MSEFERVAFVWGENASLPHQPANPPSVGVAMWKDVLPCDLLRWRADAMPDVCAYDVFLVNVFHTEDSTHIAQIRAARPDAFIVGMVDPTIDLVLLHPEWHNIWFQLSLCDLIGGRTHHDCAVYGTLLNKPTIWMPSPIHPLSFFAQYRETPKADYLLAQDHPMVPSPFAHTVAALAAIQRKTGLRIVYAAARAETPELAWMAGLDAEFVGHVPFPSFVEMTAQARLMIDPYFAHSYHRQAVLCAAVGTPLIGSTLTSYTGQVTCDPLRPDEVCRKALALLEDETHYHAVQEAGYALVEREFGVEAARERVRSILAQARQQKRVA